MTKLRRSGNRLLGENFDIGKLPPQAIELEKAVLGAIMLENVTKIIRLLKPEVFYREVHRLIYEAILKLYSDKNPIDILSVINQLKVLGTLEMVGGPYYITQLTNRISSSANIEYHVRILLQQYYRREIIRWTTELRITAFDDTIDVFDLIDDYKAKLENMMPKEVTIPVKTMKDVIISTVNDIMLFDQGIVKSFYQTGHKEFDDIMMFDTGISVLAGASGIGKSTFVTWWMKELLNVNDDISIFWVTIDHETGKSVNRKMLSSILCLTDKQIQSKNFKLSQEQLEAVTIGQAMLNKFDIEFYEHPCYVTDIDYAFKFFCSNRPKEKMKILLIDNVMRLKENLSKTKSNETDDYISNKIADIYNFHKSEGHKVHVLFLHHMTKEIQSSGNHDEAYRPTLDMVKGSSRFIDIVETAILVNRPGHYPKLLADYPGKESYLKSLLIVDIAKNTFGNTGLIHFMANMNFGKFQEI